MTGTIEASVKCHLQMRLKDFSGPFCEPLRVDGDISGSRRVDGEVKQGGPPVKNAQRKTP